MPPLWARWARSQGGADVAELTCALGPDCAGTLLRQTMRGAQGRLDVAVYEVGPAYAWAIGAAAERGVRVRLLLDGHAGVNRGCLEELRRLAQARGVRVPVRMAMHRASAEAHWKLLAGDHWVATGTGNLDWRDAPADHHGRLPPQAPALCGTREWWTFVEDAPVLAARARARIGAVWRVASPPPPAWAVEQAQVSPPVGAPQPAVAPIRVEVGTRRLALLCDAGAIRRRLGELLDARPRTVRLIAPYVHAWAPAVRRLLEQMAALVGEGAAVRILLGVAPATADASSLRHLGLETRVMDPLRSTTGHAKGMVVGDTVVVTSANWSGAGLGASLESALVIADRRVAGYFADAFDRDWDVSLPCEG